VTALQQRLRASYAAVAVHLTLSSVHLSIGSEGSSRSTHAAEQFSELPIK
jgi:hypothetical protein